MDKSEGFPILLQTAEPLRAICGVQTFIDSCFDLLHNNSADFFVDTRQNRNISFDPRGMGDNGKFDGRKEIQSKVASFVFFPCEACIMILDEVMHEFTFFWPEKIAR